jgi:LPS-assembly lipoprotein
MAVILALAALLSTGACGFKLRGVVEIPPELNPMYIEAAGASAVRSALVQRLQGSQVVLAATPQEARVIIRIQNEARSERVAAVDSGGKVLASELRYQVLFDAVAPDGKELVPQQALNLVRTYDNPDVEVLGKQLEANLIYQDLVEDAAGRILSRLRAVLI